MASLVAWNLFGYYAIETTKTIFYWSGGKLFYLVTPSGIYNWVYPERSESELLAEEIRQLRLEIQESNDMNKNVPYATHAVDVETFPTEIKTRIVHIDYDTSTRILEDEGELSSLLDHDKSLAIHL